MKTSTAWFWFSFFLVVGALIYLLANVLAPFLTAFLLAYMFNPLVTRLATYKVPRTLGVVLVFVLISFVLFALLLWLIPLLQRQLIILFNQLPKLFQWLQAELLPWLAKRFNFDIMLTSDNLLKWLQSHWQQAGQLVTQIFKTVSVQGIALVAWIANAVLIPVVTFYLLRDWPTLLTRLNALIPNHARNTVIKLANQSDEVLGAFFRGQLLVMFALGLSYTAGLWLVGLDLALLVGFISGLLSVVPYLGFIIGFATAVIAGFFQQGSAWFFAGIVLVFMIGQMLESAVYTPLFVGDRIGLHPVAVIFAVLAGGNLFGFVGVLLALPVAAVLMVLLRYAKQTYISSQVFQGEPVSSK